MKRLIFCKFILSFLVIALGMMIGLSCVDVPSTGPELPDLISEFRFLNAAADVGNVEITVDENSIGNLEYKASTAYTKFNAGSRVIVLSTNDTLRVPMPTYRRGTVIILPLAGDSDYRGYYRLIDRRVFDSVEVDTGVIRLASAAAVLTEIDLTIMNSDTSVLITESLEFGSDTGYLQMPVGNYTISAIATGDTSATVLATTSATVNNRRQTSVILGADAGSLSIVNLNDD